VASTGLTTDGRSNAKLLSRSLLGSRHHRVDLVAEDPTLVTGVLGGILDGVHVVVTDL